MKKIKKYNTKNVLLILIFLIILIVGLYLGKLLNQKKESFENIDQMNSFFSSDTIMSVKDIDLNNIINNIETNKTAIETNKTVIENNKIDIENNKTAIETNKTAIENNKIDIETNMKTINTLPLGTIIPYYPLNNTSLKLTNTECQDLLKKGYIPCDSSVFNFDNNNNKITLQIDNNIVGSIFKNEDYLYITKNTNITTTNIEGVITSDILFKIPNLQRKFIVGSGIQQTPNNMHNKNEDYNIGTIGGSELHKLTQAETPLKKHDHTINMYIHDLRDYFGTLKSNRINSKIQLNSGDTKFASLIKTTKPMMRPDARWNNETSADILHKENDNAIEHENRPPFMAMVYIYYLGKGNSYNENNADNNNVINNILQSIYENFAD